MRSALVVLLLAGSAFAAVEDDNLLAAARSGDLAGATSALQKGAAVEAKTQYGQTPLFLASSAGHQAVVKLLLEKGANPDVQDTFYKMNVMAFSLSRKHFEVVKLLIAASKTPVDILLPNIAASGNFEMVQAVLAKGTPTQSALDAALKAAAKFPDVVQLLNKAGTK